jgi:hypothetical protein
MAGKPKIGGRSDSRGNKKGVGRPKGVVETQPRKPKVSKPDILPTEEIRRRWKAAARKLKKEYGKTPEYYMLSLLWDASVPVSQKLAIFKEYAAAFKEPISPQLPKIDLHNTQNIANFGSPALLEEHPAVALPRLPSDMKPAEVVNIKSKEIMEGQE